MAVNFPDSPSNGATHSVGDIVYTYNSTKGVWADTATGSTPSLETSDNPPSSPTDGDLWFNTSDLTTYIYYADGSSHQWVKANPSQAGVAGPQGPAGADGAAGSAGGSGGSTVGTLTKSFSTNEESTITLSSAISPVPTVSVFKEIPQSGQSSKGNWDVNANATNYDFLDEKPISYAAANLTPSATGDGTFTNSAGTTVTGQLVGKTGADVDNYKFRIPSYNLLNNWVSFMSMNETGTILMMAGGAQTAAMSMHRWNLSTPYDFTTASYVNDSNGNSPGTYRTGGRWSQDGTKLIVGRGFGNGDQIISQTASAWSTTRTTANTKTLSQGSSEIKCIAVSPDGLYVWIANGGYPNDQLRCYSLSVAWDVSSTVALIGTSPQNDKWSGILSMQGSADGKKLWTHSGSNLSANYDTIYEWTMTTAWDPSTISPSANNVYPTTVANSLNTGGSLPGGWMTMGTQGHFWINAAETRLVYATAEHISTIPISSSQAFPASDVGKKVTGNSGSAIITATSGTYKSETAFTDTSTISSWTLNSAQGKADGSGIKLTGSTSPLQAVSTATKNSVFGPLTSNPPVNIGANRRGFWKPDGSRYYYPTSNTAATQYDLSTAFDLSSTLTSAGSTTLSQYSTGIWLDATGTYMTSGNFSGTELYRLHTLTTPWDISTASQTSSSSGHSYAAGYNPGKMVISGDGKNAMYWHLGMSTASYENRWVAYGIMTTAWDLSTLSFQNYYNKGDFGYTGSDHPNNFEFAWNVDGSRFYTLCSSTGTNGSTTNGKLLKEFTQGSNPANVWDLGDPGTLNQVSQLDLSTIQSNYGNEVWAMCLADNDTKMIIEYNDGGVYSLVINLNSAESSSHPYNVYSPAVTGATGQINTSSWVDISSMTADETKNDGDIFYAVSTDNKTSWGVNKGASGIRKIAKNNSGTWQYNNDAGAAVAVSDMSNATVDAGNISGDLFSAAGVDWNYMRGAIFNPAGTKMYLSDFNADNVDEFPLSTAWDTSTAGTKTATFVTGGDFTTGLQWNNDGTRLYTVNYGDDTIKQFNLSTAYDLSTASDPSQSFSIASQAATSFGFTFKADGTKMYVTNNTSVLYQYTLSTAWDVTTASYDSVSASVGFIGSPAFNSTGTIMYGATAKTILQYNLSTAWTLSTLGTATTLDVSGTITNASGAGFGVTLRTDESQLFATFKYGGVLGINITETGYGTSETWVNATTNNEIAALQQALGAKSFNRMNKAQIDAIPDANHYPIGSTLDLMIAPYATSGTSPISDGVTLGYSSESLVEQAVNGTDYKVQNPSSTQVKITSLATQNLKIRVV